MATESTITNDQMASVIYNMMEAISFRKMNILNLFNQYEPSLIEQRYLYDKALASSILSANILICGEVHGVAENADILYSLVTYYGFETLGLERTKEEAGNFIGSLMPGNNADFSLIDNNMFVASVLSPQLAKAIQVLLYERKVQKIAYVDCVEEEPERGMAENILNLNHNSKTLCILGNWHTTLQVKEHKSALEFIREEDPRVPLIEYKYCSGSYYNITGGVGNFQDSNKKYQNYSLTERSQDNFRLYIPKATPITEK